MLLVAFLFQETWALAGTTGRLNGTVTETGTSAPLANAKVTATSPSQTTAALTDANGHFSFVSLAPDTYIVSVEKAGYEPQSEPGVSVFADQAQGISIALSKALKQIANVTSRSSSDVVRPGTTSDIYSVNASQQAAVRGLGGGGSLNSAYSGIASVPGVFVPQGQNGWAQSVFIRGSNYTQLGYEFDGIPVQRAFDQYPANNVSALGQQELQVYTGSAPIDSQSSAIGGFINQVIKTGTSPGFGGFELGAGAPTYYHKAQIEAGGASPNRLFSYYAATAGYDQEYRYESQYNGANIDSQYGSLYNVVAANCGGANPSAGCYQNGLGEFGAAPLGPNGYAFGPFSYGIQSKVADRESVVNFHFGLPHKNDGGRDDIQILYDVSYLKSEFPTSFGDWNYAQNDVLNGTANYNGQFYDNCQNTAPGVACATLGGAPQTFVDNTTYTGAVGAPLTAAMVGNVAKYYQPGSPLNRNASATVPIANRDFYSNNSGIVKLQYQKNIGSSAYFRIYGYSEYSDWLQQALSGATLTQNFVGAVSPDYQVIAHTNGIVGAFVDQLNAKNLLNVTAGYTHANTLRWNNGWYGRSSQIAAAVDSSNPTNGICYAIAAPGAPGSPTYCGSATSYKLPSINNPNQMLAPSVAGVDITTIGNSTCGTSQCEFFTVNGGQKGAYNTVAPGFTDASIQDTFKPNDKLTLDLGLHYDDFRYGLNDSTLSPNGNGAAARLLWQNSFNTFYCYDANNGLVKGATPNGCAANGSAQAQWTNQSPAANDYHAFEPRFGATYLVNPLNVLRFSYGKYEQPAASAFQQYQNQDYNLPVDDSAFYGFGFRSPAHSVFPEISYNTDLSWEHQVKGSDLSWKVTPYLRKTNNEIFTVLLDPKTNFQSGINVGDKSVTGVELLVRKGDFNRNGLAAQLSYTYTHGTVHFNRLQSGTTVVDGINSSIKTYNAYTQFCATHSGDARCGSTNYANSGSGGPASGSSAPCFTTTGTPDASCATGDISNPYWNAPVQNIFNAGDNFVVYNQIPGSGASSVASSYIIPHVATLVLNYKHDKWSFTPTLQVAAGGQYGSPVQGFGVDPAGGCAAVLGSSTDPRNPYTSGQGAAYDASSCANGIVTPNQFTGHFDNFGAFREPTQLTGNLQIAYQATPKLTFTLLAVNVYNSCFGGSQEPWQTDRKTGCWYTSGVQYTGNFYNPGDNVQQFTKYPYQPTFGSVFQQAYGGQANPFNIYLTANVKL
ncbi:MAG TPA: TonB-dependent receptor [Candidatus Baltobacteraceae bacterium]